MTLSLTPIGDALPPNVRDYFTALDAGHADEAAACFAPDCRYALPPPGGHETDPRIETVGADALRVRLRERGRRPWRHEVRLCVHDGADGFVEGVLADDTDTSRAAFAAGFRLDADGRIDRYLAYVTDDVPDPIPTDVPDDQRPAGAREVLDRYFEALDDGRFDAAAACFSDDTMYSHPPYRHTGIVDRGRVVFRGREQLAAKFRERGKTAFDHEVLVAVQRGPHSIVEGIVRGLPDGGDGSFLSSLSLAADGTIRRYVSFYCEPAVRRTT